MNKLLVLTVEWPYGKGETFLENEVEFIEGFDQVYCMPFYSNGVARKVPEDIKMCSVIDKKNFGINDVLQGVLSKCFFEELKCLFNQKKFNTANVKTLLRFSAMANKRYKLLLAWIKENLSKNDCLTIYTYWMASDAAAVAHLKEKKQICKFITRCHRFDLYEYAAPGKYIPYRKLILEHVDKIFSISKDGYDYLKNSYAIKYSKKYCVSRLGTLDWGLNSDNKETKFIIVSCSNLIPVKRVDLMIETLQFVKSNVKWIHFGDGILRGKLENQRKELPANIEFTFEGSVKNTELMKWYQENHVDLFVNTSESEGIPVSIMEAMSFGIPVIATNVGGSSEIVCNDINGLLIDSEFKPEDLASVIDRFSNVDLSDLRSNARKYWEQYYSATKNYKDFYSEILKTTN